MINGQNLLDQPVRNDLIAYDHIQKIATGQNNDYTTGCLLDVPYFKEHYKMIAVDIGNNKHLMLIQKQYNKLILQEISVDQKV